MRRRTFNDEIDRAETTGMSLDLIPLIPGSAESYEQALSVYHSEGELGEPSKPEPQAFAEAIDARFGEDDWPFTGDPLVFADPSHSKWRMNGGTGWYP